MHDNDKKQKNTNPLYLIYNISKYGFSDSKNSNTTLLEVEFFQHFRQKSLYIAFRMRYTRLR